DLEGHRRLVVGEIGHGPAVDVLETPDGGLRPGIPEMRGMPNWALNTSSRYSQWAMPSPAGPRGAPSSSNRAATPRSSRYMVLPSRASFHTRPERVTGGGLSSRNCSAASSSG